MHSGGIFALIRVDLGHTLPTTLRLGVHTQVLNQQRACHIILQLNNDSVASTDINFSVPL